MRTTKKTFGKKILLVALILVIAFLALFILAPNFKSKVDSFLTNSSFANILNLKAIDTVEAADVTAYGSNVTLLGSQATYGTGSGWNSRSYEMKLSQDMLAAAQNGKIKVSVSASITIKYLFGAIAYGRIDVKTSSGTLIQSSSQWQTAANYGGTKSASGSVECNIPTTVGSHVIVTMNIKTNKGSADQYVDWINCAANKNGTASNSDSLSGVDASYWVSDQLGSVKFTATSTVGIAEITIQKLEVGGSWTAHQTTTYNSTAASYSCNNATSQTLTLTGQHKFGTQFRAVYKNNFRDAAINSSKIVLFKPRFTLTHSGSGITTANYSFYTQSTGFPASTTQNYTGWDYTSSDTSFYVVTQLPTAGMFLSRFTSVAPSLDTFFSSGSDGRLQVEIKPSDRNTSTVYSSAFVPMVIYTSSFSMRQKLGTTLIYNGIEAETTGSHYRQLNSNVEPTVTIPTGLTAYATNSTTLTPRYMTDVGYYGYKASVLNGAAALGTVTILSNDAVGRVTIVAKDITNAFSFSLNAISKVYDTNTSATLPTAGFSFAQSSSGSGDAVNSGDGFTIVATEANFNNSYADTDKLITFKFSFNTGTAGRGANYKAQTTFAQAAGGGAYTATGSIQTLGDSNTIIVTRSQGNKITQKILNNTGDISATVSNKTYDATSNATVTGAAIMTRLNDGLVVYWSSGQGETATFANINYGVQTVNVQGLKFTFSDDNLAANYRLQNQTLSTTATFSATTTANITKRAITLKIANTESSKITRIYNGFDDINQGLLKYEFDTGPLAADAPFISVKTNVFKSKYENKNVGIKKVINISESGCNPKVVADALQATSGNEYRLLNYNITNAESEKINIGEITQKEITMSMSVPASTAKIFDWTVSTIGIYATREATATSDIVIEFDITGLISGDNVVPAASVRSGAVFTDWNAGNKTIQATAAITGTDANNYKLPANTTITCSAKIDKKPLNHHTMTARYNGQSAIGNVLPDDFVFNGKEHKPVVTMQDSQKGDSANGGNNVNLTENTHFSVAYAYNINVGNIASVTASTMYANYDGAIGANFNIVKANANISATSISITYGTYIGSADLSGTVEHATDASYTTDIGAITGEWRFVTEPSTLFNATSHTPSVRYVLDADSKLKFNDPTDITVSISVSKRPINVTAQPATQIFGDRYVDISKNFTTSDPAGEFEYGIVKYQGASFDPNITLTTTARQLHNPSTPENTYNTAIVDEYDITFGSVGNANYIVDIEENYTGAIYTITPRAVKVTPDLSDRLVGDSYVNTRRKVYGDEDPVFFYSVVLQKPSDHTYPSHVIVPEYPLSGAISRSRLGQTGPKAGENVSASYTYTEGTITTPSLNPNYSVIFHAGATPFEIIRRDIELTMTPVEQIYGDPAVNLETSYTITKGLVAGTGALPFGDTLVGSPLRVKISDYEPTDDKNAGLYYIVNRHDKEVCIRNGNNPNYNILTDEHPYARKAQYNILKRGITIIPKFTLDDGKRVYYVEGKYGDLIPTISINSAYQDPDDHLTFENTADPTKPALASWDTINTTIKVKHATNTDNICINVGDKEFDISTIRDNPSWNKNYTILLSGEAGTHPSHSLPVWFRINKRPITVSPAVVNVDYLSTPPAENLLTFATVGGDGLVLGDTLGQEQPEGQAQPTIVINLQYERDEYSQIPTEIGQYNIITDSSLIHPKYIITFDGQNKFVIRTLEAHIEPLVGQSIIYGQTIDNNIQYIAWTGSGAVIDMSQLVGFLEIEYEGTYATPGNYEIKQGTLSNNVEGVNPNPNYVIIFNSKYDAVLGECIPITNPVSVQVKKRAITIIPDANQSKYFDGQGATVESPYSYTLSMNLIGSDDIQGDLSRQTGHEVGLYSYSLGTIQAVNDLGTPIDYYNFTVQQGESFQIKQRPILITPDSNIKSVYGAAQDTLITYTVEVRSPLEAGADAIIDGYPLGGSLRREPGTNVGFYEIKLGTINGAQYDIQLSSTKVYYEITKRSLQITATGTNSPFGEPEKEIKYRFTGGAQPAYGETLQGSLVRDNLETITVGQYDILQGTLTNANNANYDITFISAKYTITPRVITISPNANQGKVYGGIDPELEYTVNATYAGNALVDGYGLVGDLTRSNGETVGNYAILQGTLSNDVEGSNPNPNYNIIFETGAIFVIRKSPTVITVDGATTGEDSTIKTLIYNGSEQTITMSHTNTDNPIIPAWRNKYTFAGSYPLTIRTNPSANFEAGVLNLVVVVNKATLTAITKAEIDASRKTKIYGANDPEFYINRNGLDNDGVIKISFARNSGENVNTYDFIASSITVNNDNYQIAFGANENVNAFSITKRQISIEPRKFTKIYGTTDPILRESINTPYFSDTVNVTYTRESGDNVATYDLDTINWDNQNYTLTFSGTSNANKFEILRRNVYVKAENKESTYSEALVPLTYLITAKTSTEGLLEADTLSGEIVCNTESGYAGKYNITIGTLGNSNYNVVFTNGTYTIKQIEVTITPNSFELEYGDAPEELTYSISPVDAVLETDSLEGELYVADKVNVGIYAIEQGTLDNRSGRNRNYKIIFITGATYSIGIRQIVVLPEATSAVYGEAYTIDYSIVSGSLLGDDTLAGTLGHSGGTSNNVGNYKVTIGTLNSANQNYEVSLQDDNIDVIITARPISIKARSIEQEYGANERPLRYDITAGTLAYSDTLSGSLRRASGYSVGTYAINQGTLNNTNYEITFTGATYKITKAKLTIEIHDISTAHGEAIVIDQDGYTITSGRVFFNDNLNVSLYKDPEGTAIGEYAIIGTYDNSNYEITFIDGVYIIRKWDSVINIASTNIVKKYDGKPVTIVATSSSNQPVELYIRDTKVANRFVEPGKYNITLKSAETSEYYAPEPLNVVITILKDKLTTEKLGIDIMLQSDEGYDPDYIVDIERNDKNEPTISKALSSSQKLIRSYRISVVNAESNEKITDGTSKLRIKTPEALYGEDTVKIIIFDSDNNYQYKLAQVDDEGYITVNVENASNIAFIQESSSNILIYIIIGVVALIIVIISTVFILRKRR